ncbi:MAG: DUF362 domain-containing protein [Anaerolineales bacterium]|nr:DUF362 domain-containing protein [Anaerolineales bacterium]
MKTPIRRRQFLKLMGTSLLSFFLHQCGLQPSTLNAPTEIVTALPNTPQTAIVAPSATVVPSHTPSPQPTATLDSQSTAAIGQINTYDVSRLREKLQEMFQQIGGLAGLVRPGSRVVIKPNLTGNTWSDANLPAFPTELFVTHPALIQAFAELLIDAGAGSIRIVEGLGDESIFKAWGYEDVASRVNASLVDLCKPAPYADFATFPVGSGRQIYDVFYMNGVLKEADVFVSFAKMKCHSTTGVTLSLKNLIGLAPISLYRRDESQNHRSAFHESTVYDRRLPRVAIDLNLARPVHLALVDGIKTAEGGAGAWDTGYNPVQPGLIVASKNPVVADTVSTALMGFDPDAPSGSHPFTYADNHLWLAREAGLGTNKLSEINIVGGAIGSHIFPFKVVR